MSTSVSVNSPNATELLPDYYPAVRVAESKGGAPFYTNIAAAHKYPQWQINDHKTICALVVDIDSDNWLLPMWHIIANNLNLMPSWIIEKRKNGHGQLGWLIERVSTGENAPNQPIHYANAVRYALTKAFDGDEGYVNSRAWNPTWDGWAAGAGEVKWGIVEPRPLGIFYEALKKADLWTTKPYSRRSVRISTDDIKAAPGRNSHVFNTARLRKRGSVAAAAHAANNALPEPLSLTELRGIIRSIERWEAVNGPPWDRKGAYSVSGMTAEARQRLREQGRRGGLVNSDKQQHARAQGPQSSAVIRSAEAVGRVATARELQQQGFTKNEIAKQMNVHPGTVKRWFRQSRNS